MLTLMDFAVEAKFKWKRMDMEKSQKFVSSKDKYLHLWYLPPEAIWNAR